MPFSLKPAARSTRNKNFKKDSPTKEIVPLGRLSLTQCFTVLIYDQESFPNATVELAKEIDAVPFAFLQNLLADSSRSTSPSATS